MGLKIERKNYRDVTNVDHHQKKKMSMYTFLCLLGIFVFVGWGLMIFTVPLNLNQTFEWVRMKGIHLDGKMIKDFFLCLVTVGLLYFGLLYLYFNKLWGRAFLLFSLLCLGMIDGFLFWFSF